MESIDSITGMVNTILLVGGVSLVAGLVQESLKKKGVIAPDDIDKVFKARSELERQMVWLDQYGHTEKYSSLKSALEDINKADPEDFTGSKLIRAYNTCKKYNIGPFRCDDG